MSSSISGATANENLLDVRLRTTRHPPDRVAIDRRVAPAENAEAFFPNNPFQNALAMHSLMRLDRKEDHADAILAGAGKVKPSFAHSRAKNCAEFESAPRRHRRFAGRIRKRHDASG